MTSLYKGAIGGECSIVVWPDNIITVSGDIVVVDDDDNDDDDDNGNV
jgi:hypothetical protein